MMTFDVDGNNDLFIGTDGNLSTVRGERAVANCCVHYARALRGEMLHKFDLGMPYWQTTFGRQADLPLFEAAFRERMLELDDVESVVSFDASVNGATLSYTAVIRTKYGMVNIDG